MKKFLGSELFVSILLTITILFGSWVLLFRYSILWGALRVLLGLVTFVGFILLIESGVSSEDRKKSKLSRYFKVFILTISLLIGAVTTIQGVSSTETSKSIKSVPIGKSIIQKIDYSDDYGYTGEFTVIGKNGVETYKNIYIPESKHKDDVVSYKETIEIKYVIKNMFGQKLHEEKKIIDILE